MNEAQKRGYKKVRITREVGGWEVGLLVWHDGIGQAWDDDCFKSYAHTVGSNCEFVIEPSTFQVGETYTTASGGKVKCIYIENGLAWCVFLHGGTVRGAAYTWGMDGVYQDAVESERGPYQIKFGPVAEVKYQFTKIEGHPVTIKYTTKDGVLDEDSITACVSQF